MNTTEMHSVALHSLINDIKHLLDWLAVGLGCMAIANLIHALGDAVRHDWLGCGFDGLLTAAFVAWCYGTIKRGRKYRQGRP